MALSDEEIERIARERLGLSDAPEQDSVTAPIDNLRNATFQGMLANFGDEFNAGAKSLGRNALNAGLAIANLAGADLPYMQGSFGEDLARFKSEQESFNSKHPIISGAAQIIGSLPTASLVPIKEGVMGAGLTGAGLGALYGAGSGEGFSGRLGGAAAGGIVGGATGAATDLAIRGLGKLASTDTATELRALLKDQSGMALGNRTRKPVLPNLDDTDLALLAQTRGIPLAELQRGVSDLRDASAAGRPELITETLDKPSLYQFARELRNDNKSADIAQEFLQPRYRETRNRFYRTLGNISDETSVTQGTSDLARALSGKVDDVNEMISDRVGPFYDRAFAATPEIPLSAKAEGGPELGDIMQSGSIQRIISGLKNEFPTEYGNLPDNNLRILDQVKKRLDTAIDNPSALSAFDVTQRDLVGRKNSLVGAIDSASSDYAAARAEAANMLPHRTRLTGDDNGPGLFTEMIKRAKKDPSGVGEVLFDMEPQQISLIHGALADGGYLPEFKAGVRATLQRRVEEGTTAGGLEKLREFMQSDLGRARLRAALSPQEFQSIQAALDSEARIAAGNRWYYEGSPTASRGKMQSDMKSVFQKLKSAISKIGSPTELAGEFVKNMPDYDEQITRDLASAIFNPEQSLERFGRIAQYRSIKDPELRAIESRMRSARRGVNPTSAAASRFFGNRDQ